VRREIDLITPLRKQSLQGTLYKRDAKIEALLAKLELLTRAELIAQCQIADRNDPNYVPSECLMYFVRATRQGNSDEHFERLYKILLSRVMRGLPNPETNDGEIVFISRTKSRIREIAFDRFTETLASDRQAYSEKLDYFEVRFDGAIRQSAPGCPGHGLAGREPHHHHRKRPGNERAFRRG
jgi:hypothetical protein